MFERFTQRARRVLVIAQEEASRLGHNFIGTEHILLGLALAPGVGGDAIRSTGLQVDDLRQATASLVDEGPIREPDPKALESIGIDLAAIRASIEAEFGQGALDMTRAARARRRKRGGGQPFTPSAKKALELSLRQALHAGDSFIGTEHLVLGLLHESRMAATKVVERAGGDPRVIVENVTEAIRARRTAGPGSAGSSAMPAGARGGLLRHRLRRRARRGRSGPPPT